MLFEAHLLDGTLIAQNEQDVSPNNPEKNCFWDVLQRIDEVAYFGVYDANKTCVVDLRDGHFEINGVAFTVQDPRLQFPEGTKYRLIYFRRVTKFFEGITETGVHVAHHIGWQVTVDDSSHQYTIAVA